MDKPYLVYKSNLDESGGACPNDSDVAVYLNAEILKFNFKFKTRIGFYSDQVLDGEILKQARQVVFSELENLLDNYHIDADPNGFGRSAMKIQMLGKERILNHFNCKIDQIIYALDGLLTFFDRTILLQGKVEIFGLGDIDIIDWNIIWKVKSLIKAKNSCSIDELKNRTGYLFKLDNVSSQNPNEFNERVHQLSKKSYLTITGKNINVTNKGKVVDVWANFITKKITIKAPN
jgi:hypothetical protein